MNKFIGLILIIIVLGALPVAAKNGIDLEIAGVGARPMGMGRASVAVADDANVIFSNPWGLGLQKSWGFTSMSTKLLGRVEYKMLGGVYPTDHGTLGIGYLAAITPAGYLTTDKSSLDSAPSLSYGSSLLLVSFGRDLNEVVNVSSGLGKLSVGANLKAVSNNLSGAAGSGSGSSLDVGFIFQPKANVMTGLNFKNLGGTVNWANGSKEDLPLITNLGGTVKFEKGLAALDLEFEGGSMLVHGGIEYRPFKLIALRAGLDQSNLTGGVGIKVDGFSFDYAYRQDGDLSENSNHYISISFQPDVKVKKVANISEKPEKAEVDGLYNLTKKPRGPAKNILSYYE